MSALWGGKLSDVQGENIYIKGDVGWNTNILPKFLPPISFFLKIMLSLTYNKDYKKKLHALRNQKSFYMTVSY